MRPIALGLLLFPFAVTAQSLYYGWPAISIDPCSEWIGCQAGCTACNTPLASSAALMGTGAAWMAVSRCPHPKGDGDSVVETSGWSAVPGEAMIILSMIALQHVQVDSIIIDHQAMEGGCDRLQVRFGTNTTLPTTVVRDEGIVDGAQRTVITDLGCIAPGDGGYGTAQLILQAYGAGDGWWLDQVRIVTSPCLSTGIEAIAPNSRIDLRPVTDLLGRRVDADAPQGVYLNARHQRVLVLP
jgi:hypothetical protein